MISGKRKMPKRWFGLNVRDTEAYLRKLESMQRTETDAAEAQLSEQRLLNGKLKAELEAMKLKAASATPLPSEKSSLILDRLERSIQAIERQGDAEIENLNRLKEKKLERHSRQMAEWNKQMEDYRQALDFLLDEAAAWIGRVKEKKEREPAGMLESEARQAIQVMPERKPEASDLQLDEAHEDLLDKSAAEEVASTAKILQFKLRSILKEASSAEDEIVAAHSPMTADGLSFKEADKEEVPLKPISKKTAPSAFWGDLENYLEEPETQPEPYAVPEQPAEKEMGIEASEFAFSGVEQKASDADLAQDRVREMAEPAGQPSMESPGLSDEIHSIQNRYIVGKAAGENLYAASGRLIVAKGQMITGEIVQNAEREGKLPELIVHMVIPGFGSDES